MKFFKKIISWRYFKVLVILLCVGITFFIIDYIQVQNQCSPIFCVHLPITDIADGGTITCWGIGYKVIMYHTQRFNPQTQEYEKYEEVKIGTWFMPYHVEEL